MVKKDNTKKEIDILNAAFESRKEMTKTRIAKDLGYATVAGVTNIFSKAENNSILLRNFSRILDVLGYEVVVRDKTGKTEWVVDPE